MHKSNQFVDLCSATLNPFDQLGMVEVCRIVQMGLMTLLAKVYRLVTIRGNVDVGNREIMH